MTPALPPDSFGNGNHDDRPPFSPQLSTVAPLCSWPLNPATSRLEVQRGPLLALYRHLRPPVAAAASSPFLLPPFSSPFLIHRPSPLCSSFYWPVLCLACFGHDRTRPSCLSLSPISGDPQGSLGPYTPRIGEGAWEMAPYNTRLISGVFPPSQLNTPVTTYTALAPCISPPARLDVYPFIHAPP